MQARAEQIAAGVPRRPEPPSQTWVWWTVGGVAGVVLLVWLRRGYRRWWAEDEG
jgi:hypothetical protein